MRSWKILLLIVVVGIAIVGGVYVESGSSVSPNNTSNLLDRAIPSTSSDLDVAARTQLLKNLQTTTEALKKDSTSYQDWIDLGIDRQILGDYEGARLAWEYASFVFPKGAVAYANLGNLYMAYLKDYPKSESNYLQAIQLDPSNANDYRALFELYVYHYKQGTSAAENILKAGIRAAPQASDLKVLLERYQAGERSF